MYIKGRIGGLMGSTFSFGSGEPGLFSSLCITLRFLPCQIQITSLSEEDRPKELTSLWDKLWTILKASHVKQGYLILSNRASG